MTALNKTTRSALLKAVRDVTCAITAVEYTPGTNGGLTRKEVNTIAEANRLLDSPDFKRGFAEAVTRIREKVEWIIAAETSTRDVRRYVGTFDPAAPVPPPAEVAGVAFQNAYQAGKLAAPVPFDFPAPTPNKEYKQRANNWPAGARLLAEYISDNLDVKAAPKSVKEAINAAFAYPNGFTNSRDEPMFTKD
jgi:hypothetical protein